MSISTRPRKRFGQHFLACQATVNRIAHAIAARKGDRVIEIGPGRGAITGALAASGADVHAIEFDRDLVPLLRQQFADTGNVSILEADALQFDFGSLGRSLRIVGNLPYNISTPLMFRLMEYNDSIQDLHFMLQKEVVDRLAAAPGTRSFGRLTIMLGCRMEVERLFDVPASAFEPPPKVTSAMVRLRPRPRGDIVVTDEARLRRIVAQAFSHRRKTMRNALKGTAVADDLLAVGIEPGARPEAVSVATWVLLANRLASQSAPTPQRPTGMPGIRPGAKSRDQSKH